MKYDDEVLLTVFITTYNRANYLEEAVASVLQQSYYKFKLIILDNASSDGTEELIRGIKDKRVNYVRHNVNIGGIGNMNYAIKNCATKYFIIFHDDDIMESDMLAREIKEMEEHDYSIISVRSKFFKSNDEILDMDNKKNDLDLLTNRKIFKEGMYLNYFIRKNGSLVCPSVMFRTQFMQKNELFFDSRMGPACDQFLWFEVERLGGTICLLDEELIFYRIHGDQDSQKNRHIIRAQLYRGMYNCQFYKRTMGKYSFILFFHYHYIVLMLLRQYGLGTLSYDELEKFIEILPINSLRIRIAKLICKINFKLVLLAPFLFNIILKPFFIFAKALKDIQIKIS